MAAMGYGSWLAPAVGAGGLGASLLLYAALRSRPAGNDAMGRCAAALRRDSRAFLAEAARLLVPFALVLLFLLAWILGPGASLSFGLGVVCAAAAATLALGAANAAGVRTLQSLRESGDPRARTTAHAGAGVAGLAVGGLALLGAGLSHVVFSTDATAADLAGFALGASCVSLVARGSGVLAKAAARAEELLSRLGGGGAVADEGSSRALALSGDTVGGVAGAAADLFGSMAASLAAAVVVGVAYDAGSGGAAAAYPLYLCAAGLAASAAGAFALASAPLLTAGPAAALAPLVPAAAVAVCGLGLAALLPVPAGAGAAAVLGAVLGPGLGAATRHYASRRPVTRLAESSQFGAAANVLAGLAAGLEGAVLPAVLVGLAVLGSAAVAGTYGVVVCAAAMASCAGLSGGLGVFAPIASQAEGLAAQAALGADVREMAAVLQGEGGRQSARSRGFAAGASAMASVGLLAGFVSLAGLGAVALGHPKALAGLFAGAALPFLVSALSLGATGEVAFELVGQARRLAGGEGAQRASRSREASRVALGRTVVPLLVAVLVPPTVGLGLGAEALGGLLAGAVASGCLLSFLLADAGDVWRGGRRWIEGGALGGPDSEAHAAALVGDAVGEPLRDVAGPAVQTLVKALAAVSLVAAPLLPRG